ncbi:MAG: transcription termination factor Rho [Eubacterium sp.]|nr:transcription termination factor Rho [Eubacterium sp.]
MSYSKMKIDDLRKVAGEKGLRDIEHLKKSELIELLMNVDLMMSKAAEKKDETAKTSEKKDGPVKLAKKTTPKDGQAKTEKNTEDKKPAHKSTKKNSDKTAAENADAKQDAADNNESGNKKADDKDESQDNKSERSAEIQENKPEKTAEKQEKKPEGAQYDGQEYNPALASGEVASGILEVLADGYGFIRSDNYMPGEKDIYISPAQIRKFGLRTGDIIKGPIRARMNQNEKFRALLFIESVNSMSPSEISRRPHFEDMTPIFPNERIKLDYNNAPVSIRIVDLFSPIGKGQRGMIVSPPKAGKTTLLKQIAKRISVAYPEMNLLVLLIDERPEEVTDIKESIEGPNAEVIYSTFDELPEHHKRVSEMVIERAKRLVESKKDVVILIDSITRLSRAYNLTVSPSGRTLSGCLDPSALHMPKKFFGAARNMREGGSLTILATALIDTGSRMDDVVFEEFKGTGNMELVLDRNLSEKRVFPAIDIAKSGTRKDDLLLTDEEQEVLDAIHRQLRGLKSEEVTEDIIKIFAKTRNNREFLEYCRKLFIRKQV